MPASRPAWSPQRRSAQAGRVSRRGPSVCSDIPAPAFLPDPLGAPVPPVHRTGSVPLSGTAAEAVSLPRGRLLTSPALRREVRGGTCKRPKPRERLSGAKLNEQLVGSVREPGPGIRGGVKPGPGALGQHGPCARRRRSSSGVESAQVALRAHALGPAWARRSPLPRKPELQLSLPPGILPRATPTVACGRGFPGSAVPAAQGALSRPAWQSAAPLQRPSRPSVPHQRRFRGQKRLIFQPGTKGGSARGALQLQVGPVPTGAKKLEGSPWSWSEAAGSPQVSRMT
ncbi:uncharacterized protein LOC112551549 [Alligator sinensis]|uniref:Uncharacterized protein LOC112551549 n=1 Tax=Alligator sinensis TaxID=38654 RepID=A0A3Q0HEB6_ALLSI|nr:uncharacterized protein LOC112551549 [Alligator sinensis]